MRRPQLVRFILFFSFVMTSVLVAVLFPRLSLPFAFSYIVFLMSKPLTNKIMKGSKKQRVINSFILAILLTSLLIPLVVSLYSADTNFSELYQEIPALKEVLENKFLLLKEVVEVKFGYRIKIDPVKYLIESIESFGTIILSKIPEYISSILEWFLLTPLFLYFFFKESHKFNRWVLSGIPNAIFEKTYVLFSQFNLKFGEYIIAKFIEATILGSLVSLGLFLIGFPYAFVFGLFAGLTNILPYIGPIIGFIPPLFLAIVSKDVNASLLAVFLIFCISNLIDMVLVFPLLVSKIVNLHPIVVVVSIIIGSQIGGVVGMIFIIPFIAFFKILFREIYKDLSVNT